MRTWMRLGAAVLLVLLGTACSDDPAGEDAARVDRLEVNPYEASLLVGDSVALSAQAFGADGEPVERAITWKVLTPALAELRGAGDSVMVVTKAAGAVRIEAAAGGRTGYADLVVNAPPAVVAVAIEPGTLVLRPGQQVWLQALPRTADSTVVAAPGAAWSITPAGAATLAVQADSAWATVQAVAEGEAVVSVTVAGKVAQATVRVLPEDAPPQQVASVTIAPRDFSLLVNSETTIQAIAKNAAGGIVTGRPVTWSITPAGIADLTAWGNAFATITGRNAGVALVAANVDGVADTIRVEIRSSAPPPQQVTRLYFTTPQRGTWTGFDVGFQQHLRAEGSSGPIATPAVSWSIEDESIASVDEQGNVTGIRAGTTRVRASSGSVHATALVTVFSYENVGLYALTYDWWDYDLHLAPRVGTETWTDPEGVEHEVELYLAGGTLTIGPDGAYERLLNYEGWVFDWVNGSSIGRKVIDRVVVDRGIGTIMVGGETGYLLKSSTTPGYEYKVVGFREVGHLVMRAAIEDLPVADYLFRLKQ